MLQSLRAQLLWQYYVTMASILTLLGAVTYWGVDKILYGELDKRLSTLAELMIQNNQWTNPRSLQHNNRFSSFPNEIGVEWFNEQGELIARQGITQVTLPPQPGMEFTKVRYSPQGGQHRVRTLTLKVSVDRSELYQSPLEGYLRLSHSTQSIEQIKTELLYFLVISVSSILGVVGLTGLWLTQQAVKPVEEGVQKLKQFTADASHELRTPLASIKSCLEVIYNHPERIHPKDARKLETIAKATTRMIHLTEDLLFLARTEDKNRNNDQDIPIIELRSILNDLIELLEPLAQEKAIDLQTYWEIEGRIRGNREQISRLFINLIENAIKYTPQGGKVTVALTKQHRQGIVVVEDTGIGLEKEQLPYVFDRFWRADGSRQQGGTGLGLAIAKAIALRHGGTISVTSELDKGTCFRVSFPLVSEQYEG